MRKLRLLFTCLLTVLALVPALAQTITVKGEVKDANTGEGVPFASIQVKGTMTGTATDADGNYTIDVPRNATLIFSSIGYLNQEAAVEGRTTVNILLAPATESIEELVVVAPSRVRSPPSSPTPSHSALFPAFRTCWKVWPPACCPSRAVTLAMTHPSASAVSVP